MVDQTLVGKEEVIKEADGDEYSARVAQRKYEYGMTGKGPEMKLDKDIKLVEHIEKEIIENKKSPEVVAHELKEYGYEIEISGRTIRNAIYNGTLFNKIKQGKIIYKKEYNNKNKEKRVSKLIPAEKSIEYRPKEANTREEYGHWEGDLVVEIYLLRTILSKIAFCLAFALSRFEIGE